MKVLFCSVVIGPKMLLLQLVSTACMLFIDTYILNSYGDQKIVMTGSEDGVESLPGMEITMPSAVNLLACPKSPKQFHKLLELRYTQ